MLGDLEAGLDFVEEDIEFITKNEITHRLDAALVLLKELTDVSASRLPAGYRRRVVLAGLPNAGKSTLFNRLIGQQKAIVSPIAGTTRDYLTAILRLGSMEVELIDTAGWEDADDLIMKRAQELRAEQVSASDLVVWCTAVDLSEKDRAEDTRLRQLAVLRCPTSLSVITRCDLLTDFGGADAESESRSNLCISAGPEVDAARIADSALISLCVSAKNGDGIDALRTELRQQLAGSRSGRSELLGTTTVRCRDSIHRTIQSLERARLATIESSGDELIAVEIRQALHELSTILGEVYTDDILDHIFSNFCIGK